MRRPSAPRSLDRSAPARAILPIRISRPHLVAAAATLSITSLLHAQTNFIFTGTQSNLWNDPAVVNNVQVQPNWLPTTVPPAPPGDSNANVTIPAALTVNVNGVFTVGAIALGAGAHMELPANDGLAIQPGSFTGSGAIINQGTITIDSQAALGNSHTLSNVTLSGGGGLVLNNGIIGPNNVGYNGRFINVDNTISGVGSIGQTFSGAGTIAFTNQGLVDANVPSNANASISFSIAVISDGSLSSDSFNSGTLRASNGGLLQLSGGSIDNTGGNFTAVGANSTVILSVSRISNGTLSDSGGGLIRSGDLANPDLTNVSITGTYQITDHSSSTFTGIIQNTGTILLNSLPGSSTTILVGDTTLGTTFTGGGIIQMANQQNDNRINGIITNVDNTIEGVGSISATFTNQGTVNANVPYNAAVNNRLFIDSALTNAGTIEASNGGKIEWSPTTLTNTGGTIAALNGSLIVFEGNQGSIIGGTLTTAGTGVIQTGNLAWTNVANAGNVQITGGTLGLNGTINNTGTISVGNNAILAQTTTTLTGSGKITLAGGAFQYYSANTTLTNNSNTIDGFGNIGNGQADLFNNGTISADVPLDAAQDNLLNLQPGTASVNTGTMQAVNGGELQIFRGALTNTGATIQAAANSTVVLYDVDLVGGTVSSIGTGKIVLNNFNGTTLDGLTLNGTVSQSNTFNSFLAHTVTNNAAFTVTNSTLTVTTANATLTGAGSLLLVGGNINGVNAATPPVLTNFIPISGFGTIGFGSVDIINHAHISATSANQSLTLSLATSFINAPDGVIEASGAAGIFAFNNAALFTNAGKLQADAGSIINIAPPLAMTGGSFAGPGLITAHDITFSNTVTKSATGALVTTGSFTLASGATFDIGPGNVLISGIGYTQLPAITAAIAAARHNGNWDLPGITSSLTQSNHSLSVAIADNALLGYATYAGQPINGSTLILTTALLGDANLDGTVNLADLNTLLTHFGATTFAWTSGNFDYAPTIDLTDLADVLNNFGLTYAGASTSDPGNSTPTPEPTTLALLLPAALLLRTRKKRKA